MPEEQRSLAGYKSTVHEGSDFENPNDGKPPLNDSDEYVFRLATFPRVKTFSQLKEKKDGTRATIKVDKAICDFVEESTGNIVSAFFRVDSLNFSEDESFESGVVRFFKKIKKPLAENICPIWENHFIVGMRFRGRVVIGKDENKKPINRYFLDIPTCRPILPSDMHPDAAATLPTSNAPKTDEKALSLANAKLIVKGCANRSEAILKLYEAKVPVEILDAFKAADDAKQIVYPI